MVGTPPVLSLAALAMCLGAPLFALDKGARGGSPWGAGTLAGADGSAKPSQVELDLAELQGKTLAGVARKLAAE